MSQNFCLFHVSNLSVLNHRFFSAHVSGSLTVGNNSKHQPVSRDYHAWGDARIPSILSRLRPRAVSVRGLIPKPPLLHYCSAARMITYMQISSACILISAFCRIPGMLFTEIVKQIVHLDNLEIAWNTRRFCGLLSHSTE